MRKPQLTKSGRSSKTCVASDESQEQERGHRKGTQREKKHFCDADGLMPPQELGVGAKVKKKGRCVCRCDVVKDDIGSYAVTEQASDAVSAYTQVLMEDAPKCLKLPRSECPDVWIRCHDTSIPESGVPP